MSHFKVLVIGDNVDDQLAPYDENLETEPRKVEDYDHGENVKSALNFYNSNPQHRPEVGIDITNERLLLGWYREGENIRWTADGISEEWTTYNPKSKWDWYVIGGRYNASFKIKAGADPDDFHPSEAHWSEKFGNEADHAGASDKARKRAIDYPAMIAAAIARAEKEWAELATATEAFTLPETDWAGTRAKHDGDIDAARKEWSSHPWNAAARAAGHWDAFDTFHMAAEDPQAAHLAWNEDMAVTGYYAFVKDGEWIARGDMGWFGMSDDKVDEAEWRAKIRELIEGLPEDTWLTTVDCHI